MRLDERLLLATLEQLPVAVIVADANGRVVFANAQVAAVFGHTVDHIDSIERHATLHAVAPDGTPLAADDYPIVRALHGETVQATDMRYRRPDGVDVWLRVAAAPTVTDGKITGATQLFRNVDRERADETRLRVAERRLNLAMSAGRLGAWTLDLHTFRMACTAGCKANFGLPPDARFDYPDLMDAVHPEDRQRVRARRRRHRQPARIRL